MKTKQEHFLLEMNIKSNGTFRSLCQLHTISRLEATLFYGMLKMHEFTQAEISEKVEYILKCQHRESILIDYLQSYHYDYKYMNKTFAKAYVKNNTYIMHEVALKMIKSFEAGEHAEHLDKESKKRVFQLLCSEGISLSEKKMKLLLCSLDSGTLCKYLKLINK